MNHCNHRLFNAASFLVTHRFSLLYYRIFTFMESVRSSEKGNPTSEKGKREWEEGVVMAAQRLFYLNV